MCVTAEQVYKFYCLTVKFCSQRSLYTLTILTSNVLFYYPHWESLPLSFSLFRLSHPPTPSFFPLFFFSRDPPPHLPHSSFFLSLLSAPSSPLLILLFFFPFPLLCVFLLLPFPSFVRPPSFPPSLPSRNPPTSPLPLLRAPFLLPPFLFFSGMYYFLKRFVSWIFFWFFVVLFHLISLCIPTFFFHFPPCILLLPNEQ